MPTYRIKKVRDFSVLPNALLQDKRLSHKARGVLTYLLSKPDNWEVKRADLLTPTDKDAAIRSAIEELKATRYITLASVRDAKGKVVRWEYNVYDMPQCPDVENQHLENSTENQTLHPDVDYPHVGEPHVGEPHVGNRTYTKYREEQRTERNKELNICARTKDRRRASRFAPEDFTPTAENLLWAQTHFPEMDLTLATDGMRDHEYKPPGHTDWQRAWRTWIRNADNWGKYRRKGSTEDYISASIARLFPEGETDEHC